MLMMNIHSGKTKTAIILHQLGREQGYKLEPQDFAMLKELREWM